MKIQITVLVENTAVGRGILAEHGLAYWVQVGRKSVLFDTGQGKVLLNNARQLGIPVHRPDAIVLSHGHYDHTGGIPTVLNERVCGRIYAHSGVMQPRFARNQDGTGREVGMPKDSAHAVQQYQERWTTTDQPTAVVEGLTATGEIPRQTSYEDTGGPFYLDRQCQQPDPLADDQALFFEANRGTVVMLGCAHAGVINTLHHIRSLTGHRPIYAVLGGMHLVNATAERLGCTIEELQQFGIPQLAPAHCTGVAAVAALWNAFPDSCISCHAGSQFEFNTT